MPTFPKDQEKLPRSPSNTTNLNLSSSESEIVNKSPSLYTSPSEKLKQHKLEIDKISNNRHEPLTPKTPYLDPTRKPKTER